MNERFTEIADDNRSLSEIQLYMTSDLRARTGLSRTAVDFYIRTGLIRPTSRTESGYLLFSAAELRLLQDIIEWRIFGIGIADIKARLGR